MVGDGMIRGISGGQKKRVTTGSFCLSITALKNNLEQELGTYKELDY